MHKEYMLPASGAGFRLRGIFLELFLCFKTQIYF